MKKGTRALVNVMITLLFLATCFLACSNGANDNFKGVASLFGSRTCSYRTAITWASVTTFAGSLAAIFLAQALLGKFSGKGLVPDALTASPPFLLAVALGAGATVIVATTTGFPISTTHGLIGALVGAGFASVGRQVNLGALGKNFVLPLLVSPLLAVATGALLYMLFRLLRLRAGVTKELCVCFGANQRVLPISQPPGLFAAELLPSLTFAEGTDPLCLHRYSGRLFGLNVGWLIDTCHFLSAGAVGFARGLNDTPKIAALLLVASSLDIHWSLIMVAVAIATGGLLNAWQVADTMSNKITTMNPGQGFAANISTALLVTTASVHGLPVSTTHVSVGSLLGMGIVTRQVKWAPVLGILTSWIVTLPCAALVASVAYFLVRCC